MGKDRNGLSKKNKGFSLVELIIVITIMVILAAVIGIAIIRFINKARKQVDVETAETIYKAAELAMASTDEEVQQAWEQNTGKTKYTVTANGETYQMEIIAWARGSFDYDNRNGEFKHGWDGLDSQWPWVLELKANLIQLGGKNYNTPYEVLPFKYRKTKDPYGRVTQYADSWMIFRRVADNRNKKGDDYAVEVWIGYKRNTADGYGTNTVLPFYRLYPDTDKRFYDD
jgi:prepilin-type N-terminal cleavage/methylation domain-containing protein